jgi:hypothetical protein
LQFVNKGVQAYKSWEIAFLYCTLRQSNTI